MLQSCYINGFERASFTILGVKLAPLTLGHVEMLHLVATENQSEESLLAVSVLVCSFSGWREVQAIIQRNEFIERAARWVAKNHGFYYKQARKEWDAYIAYYSAEPMNYMNQTTPIVPWWWAYATFLMGELGMPEDKAWDTICCDAFSYFACHVVRNGGRDKYADEHALMLKAMTASGKTVKDLFAEGKL